MEANALTALLLTLAAGLMTGCGSLVVFLSGKPSARFLSLALGFSAGVMVFVSLSELLPEASESLAEALGERSGGWVATAFFFGGMLLTALIDKLVPAPENPHEATSLAQVARIKQLVPPSESLARVSPAADDASPKPAQGFPTVEPGPTELSRGHGGEEASSQKLARLGVFTALAIAIHNVPEGMATMVSAMADLSLGVSVAVAVAIHNIPEGMSVAVLVYFASRSRRKAFVHSFLSGLAEPLGALLVYAALRPFVSPAVVGALLAVTAGIMVFISFDELLPAAREYDEGHAEIAGVTAGMAVMAVSLLLL